MTTGEAAEALGTSTQTIRTFLGDGTLKGHQDQRKTWLVDRRSVDAFLESRGPLNGGRRCRSHKALLEEEVERLRTEVAQRHATADSTPAESASAISERDALRARVVVLEDTLAAMRDAADLQRQADAERSEVIKQLLAAVTSSERADALRGRAVEELEAALARTTVPGHLAGS
jgi:excisionase family DNA binding protein